MDNNLWVSEVETNIFSRVKAIVLANLKTKYPDIFITDDDEVPTDPKFPTVYINFLQSSERGNDLEGTSINGIYLTVDVSVTSTKAQGMNVAREVAYYVMDIFKQMKFQGALPMFNNDGSGTKRMVARYSRTIGYNEKDSFKN